MGKIPLIHGHRGSRGTHTENSFPSFEEGALAGSHFLELDVQITSDGVPIVYHDNFLSGRLCKNPKGEILKKPIPVRALTAKRVTAHTLGTYVAPRFKEQKLRSGQHIPTLDELFKWRGKKFPKLGLNVELKYQKSSARPVDLKKYAASVVAIIRKHEAQPFVLMQSFDCDLLEEVRKIAPEIPVSRLYHDRTDFLKEAVRLQYPSVSLNFGLITSDVVKACRDRGIGLITYTVNRPRDWARCVDWGLDAIITDYPRALKKFLSNI